MALEVTFKDQFILVTGGTRGIGAAIAKEIVACHGNIVITGTGSESPDWLHELSNKAPNQILKYRQLDFADSEWIKSFDDIIEKYPEISVCINNAGINIVSDIRKVQLGDIRKVVEVNLIAPAMIISRLSALMAAKKYGRIVNISSIFGIGSRSGRASYSATKSGLVGLTRACALDLARDGILVNAVCPGFVATDLTRRVLGEQGMAEVVQRIPVGRLADCSDIVTPVLFLASKLNTYITGQVLVADGGYLAG